MIFWIALSVLLFATLAVILRPLFAGSRRMAGGDDREVFAAQLGELEADKRRGLIGEADAQAARAEIARRLLRARGPRESAASTPHRRIAVVLLVVLFIPVFSVGAYVFLGAPQYGDQPLAARRAPISDEQLAGLVAQAEAELAQNPQDGRGWIALAPIYQRMRRFDDAAGAYAKASAILGENADWLSLEAENRTYAGDGTVSAEAKALFERAVALDPTALRPAIFLAIAARQAGDFEEAGERWRALLARSQGNEPWLVIAQTELNQMGMDDPALSGDAAPPPMVEAMVSGLAARLANEGGSVEEWVRLVRSYTVLGRMDEARATVAQALAALEGADRQAFTAAPEVQQVGLGGSARTDTAAGTDSPPSGDAAPPPMVEAMVSGLAARLANEGGSVEEWVRLVRSYTVLGRMDEARAAIAQALAALDGADRQAFAAAPDVERLNP